MNYYVLEPEVAGGFGPNVIIEPRTRPVQVTHFHYEFYGWPEDAIVTAVGCLIVTAALSSRLQREELSGITLGSVEVSKSGKFEDLYPGRELPQFAWLKVTGKAGKYDFGLSSENRLIVSERALNALEAEGMSHCNISEFQPDDRESDVRS